MRTVLCAAVCGAVISITGPASAHVTIQPAEALAGDFARFVVRVPNERDDAGTVKVEVRFPPLAFVSFEPQEGWKRSVRIKELDEPLVVFDNEITDVVGAVTWSGGKIRPNEFLEFGFSARTPDDESSLTFEAIQTYGSGEVVRWTGESDSETPAATVTTYDLGVSEGEGELAVLARVDRALGQEEVGGESSLGVILGGAGVALGAVALVLATRHRGRGGT